MEASHSRPRSEANEVPAKAQRRRFSTDEKVRILKDADSCTKPGELGALLRREGLYSSHLVAWRLARQRGDFKSGVTKKRGPKQREINPLAKKLVALEKENRRLQFRAERAEALVEILKNNRGGATILLEQKLLVQVFFFPTGGSGRQLFGGSTP